MSYDSVIAIYGDQSPVTVETSWGVPVVVHPVTVERHVAALGDESVQPIYAMLASAVEVDGEYWAAQQWAGLPKKAMSDIMKVYTAYKQLNGDDGDIEKK